MRPAPACTALLNSLNVLCPGRSKISDGICPSAAHTARSPASYHEPGPDGTCSAVDATHDPVHGADMHAYSRAATLDLRADEVIWNRKIWTRARATEGWRAYSGADPHTQHMHVSVNRAKNADASPWYSRLVFSAVNVPGEIVSPSVALTGGRYMRQLVAVGPLDSAGKGWAQTQIPSAALVAISAGATDPQTAGKYGPALVPSWADYDGKVKVVVQNGAAGTTVGVHVTYETG